MAINELTEDKLKTVYIIPHSHTDYAWEYKRQWHIQRYIGSFSEYVDWVSNNEQARWFVDNVTHSLLPFIKFAPLQAKKMKELVKAGKIEIANGGYALLRPSYIGEETFVRNAGYGKKWFMEQFDLETIDFFFNMDTAVGSSQIPQILKLLEHKYYRFQRPELSLDMRGIPRQFNWIGLDGSKVLVARGFCGGMLDASYCNCDFDSEWDSVRTEFYNQELAPRRNLNAQYNPDIELISYGCDDARPVRNWYDKKIDILGFIEEWNKREKVKLKFAVPSEYFKELEKYELPQVSGPLDQFELSYNLPVKGTRSFWFMRLELEKILLQLEALMAIEKSIIGNTDQESIKKLWIELFEISGHAIEWANYEDNDELMILAVNTKTTAHLVLKSISNKITDMISYQKGHIYTLYNTYCKPRQELVELMVATPFAEQTDFELYDSNDQPIEYQIFDVTNHFEVPEKMRRYNVTAVKVVANVEVPALGYTSIYMKPGNNILQCEHYKIITSNDVIIDNGVIIVTIEQGNIVQIEDKIKRTKISQNNGKGIVHPKFWSVEPSENWVSNTSPLETLDFIFTKGVLCEKGPLRWVYKSYGTIKGFEVCLEIVIKKASPSLDFQITINSKPCEGIFAFGVECDKDTELYGDVFYGVEKIDIEATKNINEVSLDGQFFAKSFTIFKNNKNALALISDNCSMYYRKDNQDKEIQIILSRVMTLDNKAESWFQKSSRNFELNFENTYKCSLLLLSDTKDFVAPTIYKKSLSHKIIVSAKNTMMQTHVSNIHQSLEIQAPNIIVTASYWIDNRLIIRMYETLGQKTQFDIKTGMQYKKITKLDLCDNNLEELSSSMTIKPFEIVTIALEMQP